MLRSLKISTCLLALFFLINSSGCRVACCNFSMGNWFGRFSQRQSVPEIATVIQTNQRVMVNPQLAGVRPVRVVMVASGRSNGSYATHQKVLRELASQFRTRGQFEVVTPADLRFHGHSDNILEGKFDEAELANVARNFNADTVALVSVTEFRSAPPMRASVSLAFIDSNESVVSVGLDGIWDLADPQTRRAFDAYLANSPVAARHEKKLHLQSPNSLFRFLADQMAESLGNSGF
mgnify:CR=1 FL=1